MKKYLFLALAAFGFAACTTDDLGGNNGPIHSGEVEESYIAINLSAADITRAEGDDVTDGGYVDGEANERKVATAHFFFFKNGEAFPVTVTGNAVSGPGTGVNHLSANLTWNVEGSSANISDVSNVVLLLNTYKGEYPNQIVAVLNWSPDTETSYSLNDLRTAVNLTSTYRNTETGKDEKFYIMSNSVYLAGNNIMDATPLTVDNIFDNEEAAMDHPVQIYVERVAAKVTVTADLSTNSNITIDTEDNNAVIFELVSPGSGSGMSVMVGTTSTPVYARILGWELHNDIPQSYLLKQISNTWTEDNLGFPWNSSSYYRSYWATSIPFNKDLNNDGFIDEDDVSFQMSYDNFAQLGFTNKYGYNVGDNSAVSTGTFTDGSYTYVGENTTYAAGVNTNTKIILKARLEDEDGNMLEIASWMGKQYVGEANLRTAIAGSLAYTLFYKGTGENANYYYSITKDDLVFVAGGNGAHPEKCDPNYSYVQLSDTGDDKAWYRLVNGEYVALDPDLNENANATNAFLAENVQSAILYAKGETFYYIDIRHLGANPALPGYYGIVRNHIYNVTVNSIGGYGSPVYIGHSNLVVPEYPEDPTQEGSFVSAQVNILAWRLVNQTVDIQPQPQP